MQEVIRQQKQKYLRENILDKDYDAEEFMDYCETLKGTVDIDSWTLQEMQQLVSQFINKQNGSLKDSPFNYKKTQTSKIDPIDWDNVFQGPPQKHEEKVNLNLVDLDFLESMGMSPGPSKQVQQPQLKKQPPPKKQQSITTDPSQILNKLNDKNNQFISAYNSMAIGNRQKLKQQEEVSPSVSKKEVRLRPPEETLVPTVKESVVIDQNFKASVKCRSFANHPKLDGSYEIMVTGHQVINPNPFVPNYVLYSITTHPLGVEVKRRLKDFQTFRNILKKLFPTTQIPLLERYGRRLSQTEPNTIRKQKLFLQSFLNTLLMNKNIRCKILDDFLLCQNLDSLKKIFRELQKLDRPKCIQELYHPSGKVQIEYNSLNRKYVSQQELYFEYLQVNMVKLKELYDQLSVSISNSVRIIGEIATLYDNLRDSTRNVNNLLGEGLKSAQLETTFDKIGDMHKHWGLGMKTQAKVIQVQVRHHCRYERVNIDTIREICKTCDGICEAYAKRSDKVEAAREQYQFNKRLNEYKSGVESASKSTTVLKYQAGYWLSSTVSQIHRYLSQFSQKSLNRFKIFSDLQQNIGNDLQNNWKQFQTFATINQK